ncbi:DNA polymerase ligase N-terminal domain-containing protein [Neoroseomonas lacus]|uniref:DNA ligase D 3'-phosphoesterase domain-containing protein n=1 Tax=Neoroseomonas lacus TaxID=287609 RepID=A0A917NSU0_9PROT|nr:DNA polymerase ligase N-terminal domain-containing protein [Neoroseomonas lacus]GGJ21696.1 hypothetical protein GCM10011320_31230 [Neoroseomonas lacus]
MARALEAYRAKRDFARTPEPGAATRRSGKQLTFVVQKHAARRLHYDLRLEWRGVLKSWAVTSEPLQDPAIKRLAVEVEDHPFRYGTFAGTIPQGQYGAGTVEIWDHGVWAPVNRQTVDEDLAAGHLKFVLLGQRMRGGFALIRMKPKPNERNPGRNWLPLKEGDAEAVGGAATSPKPRPEAASPPSSRRRGGASCRCGQCAEGHASGRPASQPARCGPRVPQRSRRPAAPIPAKRASKPPPTAAQFTAVVPLGWRCARSPRCPGPPGSANR